MGITVRLVASGCIDTYFADFDVCVSYTRAAHDLIDRVPSLSNSPFPSS